MALNLLLMLGLTATVTVSIAPSERVQLFCPSHSPQNQIEIDLMMGKWYIVEIIHHLEKDKIDYIPFVTLEACPVVYLVKRDASNYHVIWSESAITVTYAAKRSDPNIAGYWIASGPHNETLIEQSTTHYQYTGTIEVMKAVSNHVVLTFCKSDHSDSQLFSVILSREDWLPRNEIRGVNNMLRDRRLNNVLIKKTCGACSLLHSSPIAILTMVLLKLLLQW